MKKEYKLAEEPNDLSELFELAEWLKTGPRLTKDKLTLEFEKLWAEWVGTKYAVFCNSGSSANLLMAYAVYLKGELTNKRVIVPSVGWITSIAPFIQFGFESKMCGADENDFGLYLDQLEELIKKYNPSVVMLVQVLGVPGNMDRLLELKKRHNFLLLEDACAALGAEFGKKKVGCFGDMSSFSFYYGHQFSTIEGGMVNTNSKDFYDILLMLRSHGWGKDLDKEAGSRLMRKYKIDEFHEPFTFFVPGFNVRSTEINAFLGIQQMRKTERVVAIRRRNHLLYVDNLKTVTFQKWHKKANPCSISLGAIAQSTKHRSAIVRELDRNKIETRLFSAGNLGLHPFWIERYGAFSDSVSDMVHNCGFFLPNNESLSEGDILFICGVVNNVSP